MNKKFVIPGEVIVEEESYLPGIWSMKEREGIVSTRYGLSKESDKLVSVIPLSGAYLPQRGNLVIGIVKELTRRGWVVDIGSPQRAFLNLSEFPKYVQKDQIKEALDIDDVIVAKIWSIDESGIDLSMKSRGLTKVTKGILFKIGTSKIPRIIGKEGGTIKSLREETGCNIQIGQNGVVWIEGENIERELFAKKAIRFIEKNVSSENLTDKLKQFLEKNGK